MLLKKEMQGAYRRGYLRRLKKAGVQLCRVWIAI